MSQHTFRTARDGRRVEVMLGYDPPLKSFFMTVAIEGKVIYSNLEEQDAFGKDLSYFRQKLEELGLPVNQELFDEVALDRKLGDGVRRELHD